MLLSLHIENIAVVKKLDIDFRNGFCAMTGETGAGKSVIIGAVGLLLGEKADRDAIRTGESSAMVSGLFSDISASGRQTLLQSGVEADEDGTLLIQRSFGSDGKNSVKINGRSVSMGVLRVISHELLSIHGQNDTRALADPAVHLRVLDRYAESDDLLDEYRVLFEEYESIRKEIRLVSEKAAEGIRMAEILRYQINDIDSVAPTPGEEERLVEKKVKLKSSERILKQAGFVYKALKGSEKGSVAFLLDRSVRALESISDVIPEAGEYIEKLRDYLYGAEDIAEEVAAITDGMDADPTERLNEIESRLDAISKLKRKYGLTVESVLSFREKASADLNAIENADSVLADLEKKRKAAYENALAVSERLHEKRIGACEKLENEVKSTLDFLDMPKVVFFASVKEEFENGEKVLTENGSDHIEFFISANRGAEPKSIGKIASGGELARIMLALKCALADKEGVGTLIFDEIDAGVSGKTARKIGLKLRDLSQNAQIFCVTHSAQIASLAHTHFLISKEDIDGTTRTKVQELDREGRIRELSRILGGIHVTEAQRNAAVDMLEKIEAE